MRAPVPTHRWREDKQCCVGTSSVAWTRVVLRGTVRSASDRQHGKRHQRPCLSVNTLPSVFRTWDNL
eukprot:4241956-Prymnesium_polylepis.1